MNGAMDGVRLAILALLSGTLFLATFIGVARLRRHQRGDRAAGSNRTLALMVGMMGFSYLLADEIYAHFGRPLTWRVFVAGVSALSSLGALGWIAWYEVVRASVRPYHCTRIGGPCPK